MFLSLFLSFVLARKLRGIICVLLMTVFIVLASFFSAFGWLGENGGNRPIAPVNPLPLSFPFYASVYTVEKPPHARPPSAYDVYEVRVLTTGIARDNPPLTANKGIFVYSLFLLTNIVGAIIGYWLGKSAILERLFRTKIILSNKQSKNQLSTLRVNHACIEVER
jgi:hypothetical protein